MRLLVILFFTLTLLSGCSPAVLLNAATLGGGQSKISGLSYGDLPRQKYDLYLPKETDADTPVLLFIYGGSWEDGERGAYRFVGDPLAEDGIIVAVADYRLYPDAIFPDFVFDAAKAFSAIKQKYPDRPIFVMGHSAGAQITTLLALDPRYLSRENLNACRDMAGFIGISGPYDFLPLTRPTLKEIFPPERRSASQPINFAGTKAPPALLLHGLADETVDAENSTGLAAALKGAGNRATVKLYPDAGHINIIAAMSGMLTSQAPTRADVVKFVMEERRDGYRGCR